MENRDLQLAEQLIERAKTGEHTKFEFLRSIEEYFAAREVRKVVKKVVKSFTQTQKNLYKAYVKAVKISTDTLDVILAISELTQVINFYKIEIAILNDCIDEYACYVHSGHIIDTIIGNYRKEEDLVDFRKVEWFIGE
jgi:hypothetical protein